MKDHREAVVREDNPASQRNTDSVVDSLRNGSIFTFGRQSFQVRSDDMNGAKKLVISRLNGSRYEPFLSFDDDGNLRIRGTLTQSATEDGL